MLVVRANLVHYQNQSRWCIRNELLMSHHRNIHTHAFSTLIHICRLWKSSRHSAFLQSVKKHVAKHTSTHGSLDHFCKNFLCSAAWWVQAAKGQMCSGLNTLKAGKKNTMGLFLQSKHHQILSKFFHLGLEPVQLQESGDWSCTAQLSTVQLCLSQARTPCWITAVRTALLFRERGKSDADPHLSSVQHLCCRVTVLLFF